MQKKKEVWGNLKMNIENEMDLEELLEEFKKEVPKILRRTVFHAIKLELIIVGILLIGKRSYEKSYEDTIRRLEERQAQKDYNRFLFQLEEVRFEDGKDLSKEILNATGISVGEDEFYQKINEKIMTLQTKEEVEQFIWQYLPKYISRDNSRMWEDNISFQDGQVQYRNKEMRLDADAMEVLGNLLESMELADDITTKEEEEEWKNRVLREVIAMELYDIEFSSPKRLILNPEPQEF